MKTCSLAKQQTKQPRSNNETAKLDKLSNLSKASQKEMPKANI